MRDANTVLKWGVAAAAIAAVTGAAAATQGEMFPVNICLTQIESLDMPCVSHVDADGNGWFLVNIAGIHPDLPPYPFEPGQEFRVTGHFCVDCIHPFCGTFAGFVFDAALVPCHDGDVTGNGAVDVEDLVGVITSWGDCPDSPATCAGDADDDGTVGVGDIIRVLENWGAGG